MSIVAPSSYKRNDRAPDATRGGELSGVLRSARIRLTSATGLSPELEAALLHRHAAELRAGVQFAIPLALAAAALVGLRAGPEAAALWLALAVVLALPLATAVRRLRRTDRLDARSWRRGLLLAHLVLGGAPAILVAGSSGAFGGSGALLALGLGFLALQAGAGFALPAAFAAATIPMMAALSYEFLSASGGERWAIGALIAAVPVFGAIAHRLRGAVLTTLRQETDRAAMIGELETARAGFEDARQRAEDANLAKSRFLATMSHELRTPLNAILGFSEVIGNEILGPVGNPTYKEYAKDIHSSGQHLLDLINEILDLSRVEAGRYTLNEEAVDLVPLVEHAIGFVHLKASAKDLTIERECESDLPQVWGDPRALRQVVLNLLSNAVKFTPAGGRISVRVGWTAGGGQYVSVRDDGPGIPADEIPTVLASFGQGASAIKSAEQGTGLGLPIVQALMELHDGQFVLESEPGVGTEAIAILPHLRILEVMPAISDYV